MQSGVEINVSGDKQSKIYIILPNVLTKTPFPHICKVIGR